MSEPLAMPVYTGTLKVKRELYEVGDYVLPRALPMVPAGAFAVVFMVTAAIAHVVHLELPQAWYVGYFLPAMGAAWLANRPEIEGRMIWWFVWALLRWPFRPRVLILDTGFRRVPRRMLRA